MKVIAAIIAAVSLAIAGLLTAQLTSPASAQQAGVVTKVTICHATGSMTNPFVRITPDVRGVIDGHLAHQDLRDIIPPFDYKDKKGIVQHFPGQNWNTTGQAIFNNKCKIPRPGTTTVSTTPFTTSTPTGTTTVTVPGSTTTVFVTSPSTTVTVPGTTATVTTTTPAKVTVKKKRVVVKKQVKVVAHTRPKTTG